MAFQVQCSLDFKWTILVLLKIYFSLIEGIEDYSIDNNYVIMCPVTRVSCQ